MKGVPQVEKPSASLYLNPALSAYCLVYFLFVDKGHTWSHGHMAIQVWG